MTTIGVLPGTTADGQHVTAIHRMLERRIVMATSSFERKIVITDPRSIEKLAKIMADDRPKGRISNHPFSETERRRSEALLKRCPLRSRR